MSSLDMLSFFEVRAWYKDMQPSIVKAIPNIIMIVWRADFELKIHSTANNIPAPDIIRFIISEKSPEFNTLKYKKTNKKCWKILNFSAFFY